MSKLTPNPLAPQLRREPTRSDSQEIVESILQAVEELVDTEDFDSISMAKISA